MVEQSQVVALKFFQRLLLKASIDLLYGDQAVSAAILVIEERIVQIEQGCSYREPIRSVFSVGHN